MKVVPVGATSVTLTAAVVWLLLLLLCICRGTASGYFYGSLGKKKEAKTA